MNNVSLIPLGGVGGVTKNMYLYEYKDQILIVDCGLGFPDQTMLGVDLLLPDISYLLTHSSQAPQGKQKKIVGMVLTHGHEDHMGALPFILPQLPQTFPIFATSFTASLANEKLREFAVSPRIRAVTFGKQYQAGDFKFNFLRVTHSVPDTAHIFIKTPIGNFYHGSDFKFDPTPQDKKTSDLAMISEFAKQGVLCMASDCLGSERQGRTLSESILAQSFEKEIKKAQGKFVVTTFSSNIARINQVIEVSQKIGRKICFVGRSLIKAKEVAKSLGYIKIKPGFEIKIEQLKSFKDRDLTIIIAGSQGQEDSAMTRAANNEHRDIKLNSNDVVIFSSDPIPGNEIFVYELIDTLAKRDIRVLYSDVSSNFHVSGHGSRDELIELIRLVKPKKLFPIGGNFRHMYAYKNLCLDLGYKKQDVILPEDGQEIVFNGTDVKYGKTISLKNVYVDEVSGEEMESYVLRDRKMLSEGGIVVILAQISSSTGQLVDTPDVIIRGFTPADGKKLTSKLINDFNNALRKNKKKVTNWQHIKKLLGDIAERRIYKDLRHSPLVLPVVIEV